MFEQEELFCICFAGPSSRKESKKALCNSLNSGLEVHCLLAPIIFLVERQYMKANYVEFFSCTWSHIDGLYYRLWALNTSKYVT